MPWIPKSYFDKWMAGVPEYIRNLREQRSPSYQELQEKHDKLDKGCAAWMRDCKAFQKRCDVQWEEIKILRKEISLLNEILSMPYNEMPREIAKLKRQMEGMLDSSHGDY